MEKSVLSAIKRFNLIEKGENITVALSGGADSMALLYALLSLKEELGITVYAAHLNHLIRGQEAFRDEDFVRSQCVSLGVSLSVERVDVPSFAKDNGMSTELAARTVRYSFLKRVSSGKVATAHTASDNLETVILNLTRGSGVYGLCGIPPKRDIYVRPLLLCTRDEIEDYCAQNSIPYVTDSTNLEDEYTRNKIRHKIVPVLKDINPSVEKAVLRTVTYMSQDSEALKSAANSYLSNNLQNDGSLSVCDLKILPAAVGKRAVKGYIENNVPEIALEGVHIDSAYNTAVSGGRTSLPKGLYAVCSKGILRIIDNCTPDVSDKSFTVSLKECEKEFLQNKEKVNNLLLKNLIDCDKITGKAVVRTRKSGDTIRLAGRGCTKTLNKLYNECGVKPEERDVIPVISDDNGVIWVYGMGVAQRCAVTSSTKRAFIVEID